MMSLLSTIGNIHWVTQDDTEELFLTPVLASPYDGLHNCRRIT